MWNRRHLFRAALVLGLLAAPAAHAILPIQHWQTSSGARVYFVENHDLPMVDLSVEFPAGAGFDRRAMAGEAGMTHRLLQLGAEGMSEDEIVRKLGNAGAQLSGRFDRDRAGLTLRTLSSERERGQALDVLTRILSRPTFPAGVLEREKARLIGSIKEADTRPDTIVNLNFYRLMYRDHPYALRTTGEAATIEGMTREDLQNFYQRHYTVDRAVIAIIGDLSRSEAERIAEALARDLPRARGDAQALPRVAQLASDETRMIEHSGEQSHILLGAPVLRRDDPDYIPLYVGNFVFGGGFNSRMYLEIRENRGLAYRLFSYFVPLLQEGPFVAGMETRRGQEQEALQVLRAELRKFVAQGPTEDELVLAKQNIIGGFPLRINSNRSILGYLALIGFYRLPLTYLDEFIEKVERVTTAEIRDAFRRRIHPDRMVTVVVGGVEGKR
jgi:zinc protease